MKLRLIVFLAILASAISSPAWSAVKFQIQLAVDSSLNSNADTHRPRIGLTNLSSAGEEIIKLILTIGDSSFDYIAARDTIEPQGLKESRIFPDALTDSTVRGDRVEFDFEGFVPGFEFQFAAYIQSDGSTSDKPDSRTVLFNNGSAANAMVTVAFSNAQSLQLTFPDAPFQNLYTYSAPSTLSTPLPASISFLIAGFGVFGWMNARRRRH